MTQFNLLPDVKLEYIRAQRMQRMVLSISFVVTATAVTILVLLFASSLAQKKHLHDLNDDVTKESKELQEKPQIKRVLTVQNQLQSLTDLHAAKPALPQLPIYLDQVTPATVTIGNFTIDTVNKTITITGGADALSSVNKYVDTLKFTKYESKYKLSEKEKQENKKVQTDPERKAAFSSVVLTAFAVASSTATPGAPPVTYTITTGYDPVIFDITKEVTLLVPPNFVTTRSALPQAVDLFKATPAPSATTKGSN